MIQVRADSHPAMSGSDYALANKLTRQLLSDDDQPKPLASTQIKHQQALAAARGRGRDDYEAFQWTPPRDLREEFRDEWWRGMNEAELEWKMGRR